MRNIFTAVRFWAALAYQNNHRDFENDQERRLNPLPLQPVHKSHCRHLRAFSSAGRRDH
jgi:hypothetical protein